MSKQKGCKISRKVQQTLEIKDFIKKLKVELTVMKDHLHRAHMQFRAFKEARLESQANPNIVTIHIDWSENAKLRQAKEEKSAYYYEDQISLHAMYSWSAKGEQSYVAISNCNNHKAPAVFASLQPILLEFIKRGVMKIFLVSDSPTSQYRNKSIFWYMQQFAKEHNVCIVWIYLEANKGKGIPDGIGAVAKRAIKDAIALDPDHPKYNVDHLMNYLPALTPSIKYVPFTAEDVAKKTELLPDLEAIKGTTYEVARDKS